jgi:hypothetical protein
MAWSLPWTKRLQQAVDQVRALEQGFVPGRDPQLPIEVAKVALAEAVLAAVEHQQLDWTETPRPRARMARATLRASRRRKTKAT